VAACTTTNALIDNFEDGNNQLSLLEGRNGPDYTYADTTGSTITPAAGSIFVPATPGNGSSTRAAHFNGKLSGATTVWAGFGMDFVSPKALYNASKYAGISFFAKLGSSTASSSVRVKIPDRNTDPTGGVCTQCSNDFGVDLALTTTWTKYTILFTNMTQQAGWGAPRPTKIDPTGVVAVQFQVGAPNATYDIWIDDVTFICN
jgi:endoglucanase